MTHHPHPARGRFGRPGARLILILALSLALLLALIVGGLLLRSAVDPLARQQAEAALDRQAAVDQALPWLAPAKAAAWSTLGIGLAAYAGASLVWVLRRRYGDHQAIADSNQARIERAKAQRFPDGLQSLTFHDASKQEGLPIEALAGLLPSPDDAIEGEVVPDPPRGLPEIVRQGLASPEQLYLGQTAAGACCLRLKHAGFICIAGVQGTGKSNTAALLAAQVAALGGMIFVVDPDAGDDESLANRLAAMSGRIGAIAKTDAEIEAVLKNTAKLFAYRDRTPGRLHPPFLLLIDEFMRLAIEERLSDESQRTLLLLSGDGRKKRMIVAPISQVWKQRLAGPLGTAFRDASTHAIVHGSKPGAAELLLPGGYYGKQAAQLRPGEALVVGGGGEPQKVVIPELTPADLAFAASGAPPRPYAPWPEVQPPAASALPPTQPVTPPRAAPGTVPMMYTAQDAIVDYLLARPWSTSSQIAAGTQLDLKTVRTELPELRKQRRVVSRPASGPGDDRLEWSTSQPVNRSTAVTSAA